LPNQAIMNSVARQQFPGAKGPDCDALLYEVEKADKGFEAHIYISAYRLEDIV
jgi:hypothetical protein